MSEVEYERKIIEIKIFEYNDGGFWSLLAAFGAWFDISYSPPSYSDESSWQNPPGEELG